MRGGFRAASRGHYPGHANNCFYFVMIRRKAPHGLGSRHGLMTGEVQTSHAEAFSFPKIP